MLTQVPVPSQTKLWQAAGGYNIAMQQQLHHQQQVEGQQKQSQQQQPQPSLEAYDLYHDLLLSHAEVGLLRELVVEPLSTAADAASSGDACTASDLSEEEDAAAADAGSVGISRHAVAAAATEGGADAGSEQGHRAWAYASLCPYKDMEMVVVGSHITCPAFQRLLHACLRTLIDELGCRTFNVGALNIALDEDGTEVAKEWQGTSTWVDRQQQHGQALESSSNEICSTGSSGYSSDRDSRSDSDQTAATLPRMVASSSSSGSMNDIAGSGTRASKTWVVKGAAACIPREFGQAPVMARVVSRGKLSSAASDFGCLEVFGGASIGHTDPYKVIESFDHWVGNAYDC